VERTLLHSPFRCELLQRLVSVDFTIIALSVLSSSLRTSRQHVAHVQHTTSTPASTTFNTLAMKTNPLPWLLVLVPIVLLKVCLTPGYYSTDFHVHRVC
jgi:hypothetical protein